MDGDEQGRPVLRAARWIRSHLALLMLLLAAVWIVVVIVWIAINPVAGTGNPMD